MNSINAIFEFNPDLLVYLLIHVVIAILLLGTMRYVMGVMGKVDTTQELAKRDNFAYRISMAGSVLAMRIVLTGAITGERGIRGDAVGKIEIRESHCLVEVHDAVARKVIQAINGTTIRGRAVRADFDRPRKAAPPARKGRPKP